MIFKYLPSDEKSILDELDNVIFDRDVLPALVIDTMDYTLGTDINLIYYPLLNKNYY